MVYSLNNVEIGLEYFLAAGVAPGISNGGADSFNEGAKIWFSRYYKCQNWKQLERCHMHSIDIVQLRYWRKIDSFPERRGRL